MDTITNIDKHPVMQLAPLIKDVTQPFMDAHQLSYFQYIKVFDDGDYAFSCNRPDWIAQCHQYLKHKDRPTVYSHISDNQLDDHTFAFLWDLHMPNDLIAMAQDFNIHQGICFVQRFKDSYNLIAMGASKNNPNPIETYINHKERLLSFIKNFQEDQKELIIKLHQAKIKVLNNKQDKNKDKMLLQSNNSNIHYNQVKAHLTAQEYAALRVIAQGATLKQAAKSMQLSPRTVETYLNRIKARFHLRYKSCLVQMYHHITMHY